MRICLISFSEKRNKKAALYCASGVVSDVLLCEMMHLIYPLLLLLHSRGTIRNVHLLSDRFVL